MNINPIGRMETRRGIPPDLLEESLCMYGTIPLAASFSGSGMEDDWAGGVYDEFHPAQSTADLLQHGVRPHGTGHY